MKKYLVLPLLVPVVGFAVVKFAYWYQVKTAVDSLIERSADIATIKYDGVLAHFDGTAGIEGVSVSFMGMDKPIVIDRVVAKVDEWTQFLTGLDGFKQALPERLAMSVNGLSLDVSDGVPISSMVSSAVFAQGCGVPQRATAPSLASLGYVQLFADFDVAYRFNPENGYLNTDVSLTIPTLMSTRLSSAVLVGEGVFSPASLSAATALSELKIVYDDDSYNSRYVSHCAGALDESIETFIEQQVSRTAAQYQAAGLAFGPSLTSAYQRFLEGDGRVELTAVARDPLSFSALRADSVMDQFRIKLLVDAEPVDTAELVWSPVGVPELQELAGEMVKVADTVTGQEAPAASPANAAGATPKPAALDSGFELTPVKRASRPEYVIVSVDELEGLLGRTMRVDTRNGHRIEGELESLHRGQMRLKQEFAGGVAILPVRYDLIRTIQVLK